MIPFFLTLIIAVVCALFISFVIQRIVRPKVVRSDSQEPRPPDNCAGSTVPPLADTLSEIGSPQSIVPLVTQNSSPDPIERKNSLLSVPRSPSYFWITVGAGLHSNLETGINAGIWGVKDKYWERIANVREGDYVVFYGKSAGFLLCRLESGSFKDSTPIWEDDAYPYRVKISKPVRNAKHRSFGEVAPYLRDRDGSPFSSTLAAARAIGGFGGVFRTLSKSEVEGIFRVLGWPVVDDRVEQEQI